MSDWVKNNNLQWVDSDIQWIGKEERTYAELQVYLKTQIRNSRDLQIYITGKLSTYEANLPSSVFGYLPINLNSQIYVISPIDLQVIIKADAPYDLSVYLNCQQAKDLNSYIKVPNSTSVDLNGYLKFLWSENLLANINSFKGLGIAKNLSVNVDVKRPPELTASIFSIPPKDLSVYMIGFKGIQIQKDLKAQIESYCSSDLSLLISSVTPSDLSVYINILGNSFDLSASIYPKVVYLKRAINVALLEHKDLTAIINFRCMSSQYMNLYASLYSIMKLDLEARIYGLRPGSESIKDLSVYINCGDYTVEDKLTFKYIPEIGKYTINKIRFKTEDSYKVFDTFKIIYSSFYMSNLKSVINGILTSTDLSATITPEFDYNYSELPPWIRPKTREVVIDLDRFDEQWRRFVEIMFDTKDDTDFKYFYVAGPNKIYKLDKNRHWTVWAQSYSKVEDSIEDRANIRQKYIFDMSKYSNIDEAIRDLIDRVSVFRSTNLNAMIKSVTPPSSDLAMTIKPKVIRTWIKYLEASITGI